MTEDHAERIARLEAQVALIQWQMERLAANYEGLLLHTKIQRIEILEIFREDQKRWQKGPDGTPLVCARFTVLGTIRPIKPCAEIKYKSLFRHIALQ